MSYERRWRPTYDGMEEEGERRAQREGGTPGKRTLTELLPRGGGASLDASTRDYFELRTGRDLGDVRVHSGAEAGAAARELGASAFTVGSDVVFGAGAYDPGSSTGRQLLGHELAHVAQRSGGGAPRLGGAPGVEREADRAAGWMAMGGPALLGAPSVDAGMVLLSDLSDQAARFRANPRAQMAQGEQERLMTWLRGLDAATRARAQADRELQEFFTAALPADEAQLARLIVQHGPEPMWPHDAIQTRQTAAARHANEAEWQAPVSSSIGDSTTPHSPVVPPTGSGRVFIPESSVPNDGTTPIEAAFIPGQVPNRALIVGGVHGSEQASIEVARMLMSDFLGNPPRHRPYFTVIIVPVLFPSTYRHALARNQARQDAGRGPTEERAGRPIVLPPDAQGRREVIDPNRGLPSRGTRLPQPTQQATQAPQQQGRQQAPNPPAPLDAEGRPMAPENVILAQLLDRYRPERVASLHGHSTGGGSNRSVGYFADPETGPGSHSSNRMAAALAVDADERGRAIPDARGQAGGLGRRIAPGNYRDVRTGRAGEQGPLATTYPPQGSMSPGTSGGEYGPTAAQAPGQAAPSTWITLETFSYHHSQHAGNAEAQRIRLAELRAHADTLREIFLGPPSAAQAAIDRHRDIVADDLETEAGADRAPPPARTPRREQRR